MLSTRFKEGAIVFFVVYGILSLGKDALANSVEQVEGCVFVSSVAQDALELKRAKVGRGEAIERLVGDYRSSPPQIVKHLVDGVYDWIGTAVQPRTLGDKVVSHCLTLEVVTEYEVSIEN